MIPNVKKIMNLFERNQKKKRSFLGRFWRFLEYTSRTMFFPPCHPVKKKIVKCSEITINVNYNSWYSRRFMQRDWGCIFRSSIECKANRSNS